MRRVGLGVAVLLAASANVGLSAAQSLPEGPGRAEFQRVCAECHALTMVTDMRLSEGQWEATVSRMSTLGAKMTEAEGRRVVNYLAANFNPDRPTSPAAGSTLTAKTGSLEPSSASDVPLDLSILNSSGCLACHQVRGKGGYTAPDLAELGDRRTPEEIKAAIVSPDEEVLPENRHIRVVTNQGQTITGKLLNQDAFSIQLIDAKGQLHSFPRASLRESTILVKGLMPTYQGKLTADQIADLVRLVSALNAP